MSELVPYTAKTTPFTKALTGISEKTIEIHHDKLYVGYVNKMNEIDQALRDARTDEAIISGANQSYSTLRALRDGETFATNGVYLHEYYFNCLGGDGALPDNALTQAIIHKWGSLETFVKVFSATGLAMRGWVVLAYDVQIGRLKIYGSDAHNQGGVWGCLPIIVLDVYEHAYFMDYGADRKAYIGAFWQNMNWQAANSLFERASRIQG